MEHFLDNFPAYLTTSITVGFFLRFQWMRCVGVHWWRTSLSWRENTAGSPKGNATSITTGKSFEEQKWTWSESEWWVALLLTERSWRNLYKWETVFFVHSGTSWMSCSNRSETSGLPWLTELVCWLWCCTKQSSTTLWPQIYEPTRTDSPAGLHPSCWWIAVHNMKFYTCTNIVCGLKLTRYYLTIFLRWLF